MNHARFAAPQAAGEMHDRVTLTENDLQLSSFAAQVLVAAMSWLTISV
jgi:hypothetical protein